MSDLSSILVIDINYLAILVSAVAQMVVGSVWYSPVLFGRTWMKAVGKTETEIKKSAKGGAYFWAFIASLVTAYVLAFAVQVVEATTITDAILLGFWLWLGFVVTTSAGVQIFEGRPLKLFILNTGYYLVSLIIMTIILTMW